MRARHAKFAAGIAVSGLALYFLLTGIDASEFARSWSHLSAVGLLLAIVVLSLDYTLRIARWWLMLRALEPAVRLRDCVTPFISSIALNNVLPLRAGDAARAFGFRSQLALGGSAVLGTVLLERLLDLCALLVFFFGGLALAPADALPGSVAKGAAVLGTGALLALVVLPFAGPVIARRLLGAGAMQSRTLTGEGAAAFLRSFESLRSARQACLLVVSSGLIWLLEGAVFATVAVDMSLHTPIAAAWFSMALGTLGTLLPSTPGYVGTFDYFAMAGLSAFGASRDSATAFSLAVHAVLWAPLTLAGFTLLAVHGGLRALRPLDPEVRLNER